ncbi:MAG: hypothetical protein V3U84_12515, partial [Thiotrichaceae bacterium]
MYILIEYKPDEIDTCMGCVMDRYSSEFEIHLCPDEESLIRQMATTISRNDFTERGDANTGIVVIKGKLMLDDVETNEGSDSPLWQKARHIAESLTTERREKIEHQKKLDVRNKQDAEQREEKRE